jgi:hypothetical protein
MAEFVTVHVFNTSAGQTLGINLAALLMTSCNIILPNLAEVYVKINKNVLF